MSTKNIVPRTGSYGEIGTSAKPWAKAHIDEVTASVGVSASYFYGDGSNLTGIATGTPTLDEVTTAGNTTTNNITIGQVSASYLSASSDIRVAGNSHFGSELTNTHIFTGSFHQTGSGATSIFKDRIRILDSGLEVFTDGETSKDKVSFTTYDFEINDQLEDLVYRIANNGEHTFYNNGSTRFTINGNGASTTQNITASGHMSASVFYGDGSGLTGVTGDWDGQHTGDAGITGSLEVQGNGGIVINGENGIPSGSIFPLKAGLYNSLRITSSTSTDLYVNAGAGGFASITNGYNYSLSLESSKAVINAPYTEIQGTLNTTYDNFLINARPSTYSSKLKYFALGQNDSLDAMTITAGQTGTGDNEMAFFTSNSSSAEAERMRIDVSGNIGIGTTTPTHTLDVIGDISASLGITASSFVGDGSGLTNLPAASWDGQLNGDAGITGSLDVTQDLTASVLKISSGDPAAIVDQNDDRKVAFDSGDINLYGGSTGSDPTLQISNNIVEVNLAEDDVDFRVGGASSPKLFVDHGNSKVEVGGQISASLGITGSEVHTPTIYATNFREAGNGNLEMQLGLGSVYVLNDLKVGVNAEPDVFVVDRSASFGYGKVGVGYDLADLPDYRFSVSGSTKLGELSTDLVEVTGTVEVIGDISASVNISASAFYGKVDVFQPGGGTYRPIFADVLDGEATLGVDASMAYNNALNTLYVANVQGTGLFTSVTSSIDLVTMDDTDEPATPTSAAHLYSKSGALYTKNDDGIESLIEQRLIAMSKIETVDDTAVACDIKLFSDTTSGEMEALQWTIDSATRYAKVTFTAPANGQAKVCMSTFLKDAGGTSEVWFGLHNSSTSTTTPTYGWFQISKDSEAGEHDLESVDWVLTGLTAGASITVYVHAVCSLAGSQVKVGRPSPNAWSNNDLPKPTTISVYTVPVTIDVNPT